MQTLIITDNNRQAEFLKKGLQYDNVSADIFTINDFNVFNKNLYYYDGVFLLINSIEKVDSLCKHIRSVKNKMPIIVLAQEYNEFYEVILKSSVITNYYIRPFPFTNIATDMKIAIFRVKEHVENSKFVLRDLELDILSHVVLFKKCVIPLRNKEFSLLHFMMMNVGKVLSRTMILEHVWDRNSDLLTNTVDVHISQLRKKIDNRSDEKYIHTIPCMGYLLS